MFGVYDNIAIKGIEMAVPMRIVDNSEYNEQMGERKVAKQVKLTGIRRLHIAEKESTEDLCVEAAEKLLNRLSWNPEDIKGIILVTQTPSCLMPATAFIIQKRLGIGEGCIAFDVNLGCSGYTSGLTIAGGMLSNFEEGSRLLLLVGDTLSKCLAPEDIQNRMMFGDAGTATALEVVKGSGLAYMQKSLGQQYDKIYMKDYRDYFYMDGMEVFRYTINQVVGYVKEFMERAHILDEDIDYYVFHQAQKHIVDNIVEFCEIEQSKVLTSYEDYGNTAGASIPVTLAVNADRIQQDKNRALLCGFGVGLSCGIVYGRVCV